MEHQPRLRQDYNENNNWKRITIKSIEQYIVRELKEDIKLLIKKVTEIDQKLGDVEGINKETQKGSQEYRKLAGDIEKRYQG